MLSFPSLEHLLVVQRRWDSGVQGVGSRPEHSLPSFLEVLHPQGGEQQGELLNAAGEAAQGRGCGEVG